MDPLSEEYKKLQSTDEDSEWSVVTDEPYEVVLNSLNESQSTELFDFENDNDRSQMSDKYDRNRDDGTDMNNSYLCSSKKGDISQIKFSQLSLNLSKSSDNSDGDDESNCCSTYYQNNFRGSSSCERNTSFCKDAKTLKTKAIHLRRAKLRELEDQIKNLQSKYEELASKDQNQMCKCCNENFIISVIEKLDNKFEKLEKECLDIKSMVQSLSVSTTNVDSPHCSQISDSKKVEESNNEAQNKISMQTVISSPSDSSQDLKFHNYEQIATPKDVNTGIGKKLTETDHNSVCDVNHQSYSMYEHNYAYSETSKNKESVPFLILPDDINSEFEVDLNETQTSNKTENSDCEVDLNETRSSSKTENSDCKVDLNETQSSNKTENSDYEVDLNETQSSYKTENSDNNISENQLANHSFTDDELKYYDATDAQFECSAEQDSIHEINKEEATSLDHLDQSENQEDNHKRVEVNLVSCTYCGLVVLDKELDEHVNKHNVPNICPVCTAFFSKEDQSAFESHVHRHFEGENTPTFKHSWNGWIHSFPSDENDYF